MTFWLKLEIKYLLQNVKRGKLWNDHFGKYHPTKKIMLIKNQKLKSS